MQDLNTVRFISARFNSLQGLRIIPWLLLILIVLLFSWFGPVGNDFSLLFWIGYFFALYGNVKIGEWYRLNFGEAQPTRKRQIADTLLFFAISLVAFLALIMDAQLKLPVSLFAMTGAVLVFLLSLADPMLAFLRWLALVLVGLGLLPAIPLGNLDQFCRDHIPFVPMLVVLALSGGAIYSHFLLVRLLKPLKEED